MNLGVWLMLGMSWIIIANLDVTSESRIRFRTLGVSVRGFSEKFNWIKGRQHLITYVLPSECKCTVITHLKLKSTPLLLNSNCELKEGFITSPLFGMLSKQWEIYNMLGYVLSSKQQQQSIIIYRFCHLMGQKRNIATFFSVIDQYICVNKCIMIMTLRLLFVGWILI